MLFAEYIETTVQTVDNNFQDNLWSQYVAFGLDMDFVLLDQRRHYSTSKVLR